MAAAVQKHRSDIVFQLYQHFPHANYNLTAALTWALRLGDFEMAEWLVSHGAEWPERTYGDFQDLIREIAEDGRLDVLQWLAERGQLEDTIALAQMAASRGQVEVLHWLINRDLQKKHDRLITGYAGEACLAIHTAAIHGQLQVAKCLHNRINLTTPVLTVKETDILENWFQEVAPRTEGNKVFGKTMVRAAWKGLPDIMKWLYAEFGTDPKVDLFNYGEPKSWERPADTFAINAAAQHGHLEVVKNLHQCTKDAMDAAASNGHLHVVKWLHENRLEGCSTRAMDGAAAGGHLDVIKWLH